MPPKNKNKNKNKKKTEEAVSQKLNPYTIKTDEILTILQLLNASEEHVVFLALCEVDMFMNKYEKRGLDFLEEHNIAVKILANLDKSRNTALMVMKILIKMLAVDSTLPALIEHSACFHSLLKFFKESVINIEIEYSGKLLSEICTDMKYAEQMATDPLMNTLFNLIINNIDPDIKSYCLKLLYCIVTCTTVSKKISDSPAFKVSILNLVLEGPYKALRPTVVDILLVVSNIKSEAMQKQLYESNSIMYLFDVLLEHEWTILQSKSANTILNCIKYHPIQTLSIETKKFLHLVNLAKDNPNLDPDHASAILSIIVKLAEVQENLQPMVDFRVYEVLHEYCRFDSNTISMMFCDAVSVFAKNCHIIKELANMTTLREIQRIMRKKNLPWIPYRQAGMRPLHIFLMNTPLIAVYFFKSNIIPQIQDAILSKCRLSSQYYKMALEIFQCMLRTKCLLGYLWNPDVYNQFVQLLNDFDEDVIEIALEVLKNTLTCDFHRGWFLNFGGIDKVTKLLLKLNFKHLNLLLNFSKCATYYKDICLAFYRTGIIKVFEKCGNNKCHLKSLCDSIISDIYRIGLSTKFYETGELDYTDKTRNGFCVCTGFRTMEESDPSKLSVGYTVLTVNFHGNEKSIHPEFQDYMSDDHIIPKKKHTNNALSTKHSYHAKQNIQLEGSSKKVTEEPKGIRANKQQFPPLHYIPMPDYFLKIYLEKARNIMSDNVMERDEKIKALAKLVASGLSGHDEEVPLKHQFETHIAELKKKLQSNYIPIGYLRMGTMLERAVLFKVLADRVNIPCTLKRGEGSIAWNEIWHGTYYNNQAVLPHYLRSHYNDEYVVDLITNIGNLMSKGSDSADRYCSQLVIQTTNLQEEVYEMHAAFREINLRTINY